VELHELLIDNGVVKLDGFELKGVNSYKVEHEAGKMPTVTLTLYMESVETRRL